MLWTIALVVFAWLLAGEIFGRDRQMQFAAAGVTGLLPMVQFVSASVTPDAMLYAVWAAAFWRGTVVLKRGLTPVSAAIFLAMVGAACVVKATSYALVPGALFVLAVGLWRIRRIGARALLRLSAAGAGLVLTLGIWFFVAHQSNRSAATQVTEATNSGPFHLHDFLSYLYQYYFPRFPGQGRYPFPPYFEGVPFHDIVLRGIFGNFGWTEVRLPSVVYTVLTALTGVVAAAAVAALRRFRKALDLPVLVFFGISAVALLAGLQWTDYKLLRESGYTTGFNQGRYLLPLAALAGLTVAMAVRLVPARWRSTVIAFVVVGLVILNVFSYGVVAWRFYA
jgi:4-amino-4-deoxy-L-arabinose transferase-like glycosyltransferase